MCACVYCLRRISNSEPVVCIIAFEYRGRAWGFKYLLWFACGDAKTSQCFTERNWHVHKCQNCICAVDKHVCILIIKFDFARLRVHKTTHANSHTYTHTVFKAYTSTQVCNAYLHTWFTFMHTYELTQTVSTELRRVSRRLDSHAHTHTRTHARTHARIYARTRHRHTHRRTKYAPNCTGHNHEYVCSTHNHEYVWPTHMQTRRDKYTSVSPVTYELACMFVHTQYIPVSCRKTIANQ